MKNKVILLFISCLYVFNVLLANNEIYGVSELMNSYKYQESLHLLEQEEPTIQNQLKKVKCFEALNLYSEAITILEPLCQSDNTDVELLINLASLYSNSSQSEKSLTVYQTLINQDPNNIFFKIREADLLYSMNDYRKALGKFLTINETFQSAENLKKIALCYNNLGEMDNSQVYFKKILELKEYDPYATAGLLNIALKQKNYQDGLSISEEYIRNGSENKQINVYNALFYYYLDKYDGALTRFEDILSKGDSSVIVLKCLGMIHYMLEIDYYKSEEYLTKAYEKDSTDTNTLFHLARVCSFTSSPQKAVEYYNKLLDKLIPSNETLNIIYGGLGRSYQSMNDTDMAIANYTKALEYSEPYQQYLTMYKLAENYHIKNDIENTRKYFSRMKDFINQKIESISKSEDDSEKQELDYWQKELESINENILKIK